jgi:hypothetical protein
MFYSQAPKIIGFLFASFFVFGLSLLALLGYVVNIDKFFRCDFQAPYKTEIIRGIGIISPLGCITGWIKIEDTPQNLSAKKAEATND